MSHDAHTHTLELSELLQVVKRVVVILGTVAEELPVPWKPPLVSPLARSTPHPPSGAGTALLPWQPAGGKVGSTG